MFYHPHPREVVEARFFLVPEAEDFDLQSFGRCLVAPNMNAFAHGSISLWGCCLLGYCLGGCGGGGDAWNSQTCGSYWGVSRWD